jgi:hypothetical protein
MHNLKGFLGDIKAKFKIFRICYMMMMMMMMMMAATTTTTMEARSNVHH